MVCKKCIKFHATKTYFFFWAFLKPFVRSQLVSFVYKAFKCYFSILIAFLTIAGIFFTVSIDSYDDDYSIYKNSYKNYDGKISEYYFLI